ncbi:MAG TPA: hypothetical protein VLC09_21140 [Polyangiaceae bacterium]|nr:hypothetical protein [Polyangiaceae bacterium]
MTSPLPETVARKVEQLRSRRGSHAALVERLLRKREAAGTDEERASVDELILALGRPSRLGLFLGGAFGLLLLALGANAVQGYRYAAAVREGERRVAEIRRLDEGFCWFGSDDHECIELTLRVATPGGATIEARLTYDLPNRWLSRVQPGSFIYVSLDRAEGHTVRFDEAALSEPPPPRPAR